MTHLLVAFAGEAAHEAANLVDGGALARFAWLIPVVPLVAMFVIVFVGKRLPMKGWELAEAAMLFDAVYGVALFISNAGHGISYEGSLEIGRIGSYVIEWGWVVDGLSIMMYALVGVVGLAVFTYAKGYMKGDVRFTWFFAAFTQFAGGHAAPGLVGEHDPADRRVGARRPRLVPVDRPLLGRRREQRRRHQGVPRQQDRRRRACSSG